MKNMTLKNIRQVTGGRIVHEGLDDGREITGVVSDSRRVYDGCLFLCIEGEKVDGHDYAEAAVNAGAYTVISTRVLPGILAPYIIVDSMLDAVQAMAEFYRKSLEIKVVGVTGSVGKTSTKEFIASVLRIKYKVSMTKGNFNNQWGVPFTIFDIKDSDNVAVIEMGVSDFGEMEPLSKMARPDVAVITNIGQSHLEFFRTRDGILREKAKICTYMKPEGHVVLNGDDDKLPLLEQIGARPLEGLPNMSGKHIEYFGFGRQCDVGAERVKEDGFNGSEFDISIRDAGGAMKFRVKLPVPGKHMILNALAATQVGLDLGLSPREIQKALEKVSVIAGRNNFIETKHFTLIDDCYNASPTSMASSIDLLTKARGRKVAILGDMLELGDGSEKLHYKVGLEAGKAGIDLIVCVGELSEKMYMGALMESDLQVEYYKTIEDAISMVPRLLKEKDTILLKASNSMHFSRILEMLKNL